MEPIRILHETVIMDPGGIESLLMNIYRHIDKKYVQFDFLVHRHEKGIYEDEIKSLGGCIYKTKKFNPFPMQYSKYMCEIEGVLRAHPEYRIIHAHSELNLWPLMIAKKIGIPTRIAHSHNAKSNLNLKYFFLKYEQLNIKKYCTDMFMCSTPAGIWSFGEKAVKKGDVTFIKNGIETERFVFNESVRRAKRMELGLNNKFVVGHVGRFMKQKNHDFLIDIFKRIHEKQPNSILLLVGEGRLSDSIKKKVWDEGLGECVVFLGNRTDVNELMQAMDIFLFPSLWEGLPLTGIEAQTSGLPVVMSDVITEEVCITDSVLQVSLKESAEVWAKKTLEAGSNFVRRNTRKQIVEAGFDITSTAAWLQDFYIKKMQ